MRKANVLERAFLFLKRFSPSFILLFPLITCPANAADSVCADVKIEIKQELTLERQAFDAHMRINNGLSHITLEDIAVEVLFTDADGASVLASSNPDDTTALFFIRLDSMENVNAVDGSGRIEPSTSADIHWLIIPSPDASNGLAQGTLYYVGATLTYTIGGEEHTTEVSPDYIYVKPMPELTLDYFLPSEVYGDDAFTPEIEPPVPFNLGVRVKNNGSGTARDLKIDSAQPKIVENQQGLLVGFVIEGSEVNGGPAEKSLLADLGDISPGASASAHWIMTCTLSGRFVSFDASFSHSDELGGELTSLLEAANTHFLVRDVLVDLPGRDAVRDFLAKDGDVYRVYESDAGTVDREVLDLSASSSITASGAEYTLSVPVGTGFFYVKLPDPSSGQKAIRKVLRSDGKRIRADNAWLSKTRNETQGWDYLINLFDVSASGSYSIVYEEASSASHAPVLQFIPDSVVMEGEELSFTVEATDEDGTVPSLSASPLPALATFSDSGDGTGIFRWAPAQGQAGQYPVTFSASDGLLTASQRVILMVNPLGDSDGDGMSDEWEMEHFGTLDRDGTGDFDGDGISDLDEYLNGMNPAAGNHGPTAPEIETPTFGAEVVDLQPELIVENASDPDGDPLTYVFELYADEGMTDLVASASDVAEGSGTSSWVLPVELGDNTRYFWRVRAFDGALFSLWAYGSFFVNQENEPPGDFSTSGPSDNAQTDSQTPLLEINNSSDPDQDGITYTFELYADDELTTLIVSEPGVPEGADGTTSWLVDVPLTDGAWYFWRTVAADEHGATKESPPAAFRVNTLNAAPLAPSVLFPADGSEWAQQEVDLVATDAPDANGGALSYFFQLDKVATFDSPYRLVSGAVNESENTTGFHVTGLQENTSYYWRVKASDGAAESPWSNGSFFVNEGNDTPSTPAVKNPGQNAWVTTLTPVLEINPSKDPDSDVVVYRFEIYSDVGLTDLVVQGESDSCRWAVPSPLADGTWYYWRVQAVDEHGAMGLWSPSVSFFVRDAGVSEPPEIALLEPAQDLATNRNTVVIRWEDSDPDSNGEISLYYETDNEGEDGILIATGLSEDPDGEADSYSWDISGVAEGEYSLYGVISDGNNTASSYGPGRITVDRTPPVLTASPLGGDYGEAQTVRLSSNEEGEIFFSTDGAEPTVSSSIYTEPLTINETTTLRAMAVDAAGNRSEILTLVYTITKAPENVEVKVATDQGRAISGVRVYGFTGSGNYTGKYAVTDQYGLAVFDPSNFSEGTYQFRVDYVGYQFWSETIDLPGAAEVQVTIGEETAEVTVTTGSGAVEGARVYLFSQTGSYLGLYKTTDAQGCVSFDLPTGKVFKFRADILGGQYRSADTTISGDGTNSVDLASGGGLYQVAVEESPDHPLAGIKMYLFNVNGTYLGLDGVTDSTGLVGYHVPEGDYRVRADYLGYQFFSPDTHVSTDTTITLSVPHRDVRVSLNGAYQGTSTPLEGIVTYLFNESGDYLNLNLATDQDGQAVYHLPQKPYKIRADYLGRQYWTDLFTWEEQVMEIPMADAEITATGGGFPLAGRPVHVFSTGDAYLGLTESTDQDGRAWFRLPEGSYKFRVDHQGNQYWSGEKTLTADLVNPISISTGGGSFALAVLKGADAPLSGVNCYVFSTDGAYLGLSGATDADGRISFDLADGSYKFRIDCLGSSFWSDPVIVPEVLSAEVNVFHETVEAEVQTGFGPPEGVRVYLFSEDGAYLGVYKETDSAGKVFFDLPAGCSFQFRVDILDNQYWSALSNVAAGGPNFVPIEAGGGRFRITVQEAEGSPREGIKVNLFGEEGDYLGLSGVSDAEGLVAFDVPEGIFKVRVDYMGYQFWSEGVQVSADKAVSLTIPQQGLGVSVSGLFQGALSPVEGVRVYLFSPTDAYLGLSATTDAAGKIYFGLPQKDYKVRVDLLGEQYWSGLFNGQNVSVNIPMADVEVTMTGGGFPQSGQKVYAYSETGSYLEVSQITDEEGKVYFRLPAGSYKFRVDHQGKQYWSELQTLEPDLTNPVIISTGGGSFSFTVEQAAGIPLVGAECYVFNQAGAYIGMLAATDDLGGVYFDLASGVYIFRVDHLGYSFWSDEYDTSTTLSGSLNLAQQDVAVTVEGFYQSVEPIEGAKVYLFSPAESYLGQYQVSDDTGRVSFNLPDQEYKVRVDYLGEHFWSDVFRSLDTAVTIKRGETEIHVRRSGSDLEGAKVYLFNQSGAYQGRYEYTDATGAARFLLPDRSYKFRIDQGEDQVWTPLTVIQPSVVNAIEVNLD